MNFKKLLLSFLLSLYLLPLSNSIKVCEISYNFSGMYNLENVNQANISFFCIPYEENVIWYSTNGELSKNSLNYNFQGDAEGNYFFNSLIVKNSSFIFLDNYPKFSDTSNYSWMINFSDGIDYNDNLLLLASNLTGKSYIDTIFKSFYWVCKNIKYDESLKEANLTSTQVFQLRRGVCRHYSRLLLSLLYLQGIPAREVNGFALTNSSFEPHSWVEVYIPHCCFLEVDPTFCQFIASPERIKNSKNVYYTVSYTYINSPEVSISNPSFTIKSNCFYSKDKDFEISISYNREARTDDFIIVNITVKNLKRKYLLGYYKVSYLTKNYQLKLIYGKDIDYFFISPNEKESKLLVFKTPNFSNLIITYPIIIEFPGIKKEIKVNVSEIFSEARLPKEIFEKKGVRPNINVSFKEESIIISGNFSGLIKIIEGNKSIKKEVSGNFSEEFILGSINNLKVCLISEEMKCFEIEIPEDVKGKIAFKIFISKILSNSLLNLK